MEPTKPEDTQAVGPGALIDDRGEAQPPLLEGADDYTFVEVFNPLSVAFVGQVGVSRPTRAPIQFQGHPDAPVATRDEQDLRRNYGLDLRGGGKVAETRQLNYIEIPSGQTRRLLGGEAQVVVRQLVNIVMQREGNGRWLADPYRRRETEERIVQRKGSVLEAMGNAPVDVKEQLKEALAKMDGALPTNTAKDNVPDDQVGFAAFRNSAVETTAQADPGQRATGESPSGNRGRKGSQPAGA